MNFELLSPQRAKEKKGNVTWYCKSWFNFVQRHYRGFCCFQRIFILSASLCRDEPPKLSNCQHVLCLCLSPVLTGNNSDISTSTRRTQGFDILILMSRPSSQAHKLLMLVLMLASLVRTGLNVLSPVLTSDANISIMHLSSASPRGGTPGL